MHRPRSRLRTLLIAVAIAASLLGLFESIRRRRAAAPAHSGIILDFEPPPPPLPHDKAPP